MAKHSMICHPDTQAKNVEAFAVEIERQSPHRIWICYHVDAPVDDLKLGRPDEPERREELWKTTCFEAFVREANSDSYLEFNFAPTNAWAAYSFTGYREEMNILPMASVPEIGSDASESHFALEARFELPADMSGNNLLLAVTAVIEEQDGTKSYWSLAHPPGDPDFHHPDCFTLRLPARAEP